MPIALQKVTTESTVNLRVCKQTVLTLKDEMSMIMIRENTRVTAMSWPIDTANGKKASSAPLILIGEISDTYV